MLQEDFKICAKLLTQSIVDAVLAQIVEKQYALPYAADTRKMYKIGVNYDSAARNLTEWKVVEKG